MFGKLQNVKIFMAKMPPTRQAGHVVTFDYYTKKITVAT